MLYRVLTCGEVRKDLRRRPLWIALDAPGQVHPGNRTAFQLEQKIIPTFSSGECMSTNPVQNMAVGKLSQKFLVRRTALLGVEKIPALWKF
jgi:hypothetical protein